MARVIIDNRCARRQSAPIKGRLTKGICIGTCSHNVVRITLVPLGSLCKIITHVGLVSASLIDRDLRNKLSACLAFCACLLLHKNATLRGHMCLIQCNMRLFMLVANKQTNPQPRFIKRRRRRRALSADCADTSGHQMSAVLMRRYLNCIDTVPQYAYSHVIYSSNTCWCRR